MQVWGSYDTIFRSHPSRGAWIEMSATHGDGKPIVSRTPHGVRGLKYLSGLAEGDEVPVAPLTGCVD